MNYLQKNIIMGIISLGWLLISSCGSSWKTIQTGYYKGKKYVLQERSKSNFASVSNSLDWRLKLEGLPAIAINANTTVWGPPYSNDIFGANSYLYITDKDTAYSNLPLQPGSINSFHTMLYVNDDKINERQFESYYQFMKDEWHSIDSIIEKNGRRNFPHLLGLVYGKPEKFALEFKGVYNNKKMLLRIESDGRVRLINDDKWQNENYSGLSQKVQMPGKRLLLDTLKSNGGLTQDELRHFRNEKDKPVEILFTIVPATDMSSITEVNVIELLSHKWHATHFESEGQRQPLEQGEDGSYLLFFTNGTVEEADAEGKKLQQWVYDHTTKKIKITRGNEVGYYTIETLNSEELVIKTKDAAMGEINLVLKKVVN
jgi:hypothetical protein